MATKSPWQLPLSSSVQSYDEWGTTLWHLEDSNFFSNLLLILLLHFKVVFGVLQGIRKFEWYIYIYIFFIYCIYIYTYTCEYTCQGYDIWLYDLCMKYYSHSLAGVFFVAASKIHGFLPLTTKTPTEIPHENLIFDPKNWHTKILGTITDHISHPKITTLSRRFSKLPVSVGIPCYPRSQR